MMGCPSCGIFDRAVVKDSRPSPGNRIRRRRLCESCGHRWTTWEVSEADAALIDGRRFDPGGLAAVAETLRSMAADADALLALATKRGAP